MKTAETVVEVAEVVEVGRDAAARLVAERLAAPFDPKEIKFKPQMVKNNRALAMAYVNAQLVCDRLDEAVGVENWQDRYAFLPDGAVVCRLSIKFGNRWVTKTDVGSPSEQPDAGDRTKAAVSDALKRAAVKFGVARYLHRVQPQWVDYDPVKKQLTGVPNLPAFALPRSAAAKGAGTNTTPAEKLAPERVSPPASTGPNDRPLPKSDVQPKPEPETCRKLPVTGAELHKRLERHDSELAGRKLCVRGSLLAHVTQAGLKRGYPANMADWQADAIAASVELVRDFEKAVATPSRGASQGAKGA